MNGRHAYNDLKKELAPVKEELEELKKIKYFISKVMPTGIGGTAGDNFDAPVIDNSDEPHKKQNKSNPDGRDDD